MISLAHQRQLISINGDSKPYHYLVVGLCSGLSSSDLCRGLSSLIEKVSTMRELPGPELRKIFWSRTDEKVTGEKKHRTDAPSWVSIPPLFGYILKTATSA